jgi:hypothetical protein
VSRALPTPTAVNLVRWRHRRSPHLRPRTSLPGPRASTSSLYMSQGCPRSHASPKSNRKPEGRVRRSRNSMPSTYTARRRRCGFIIIRWSAYETIPGFVCSSSRHVLRCVYVRGYVSGCAIKDLIGPISRRDLELRAHGRHVFRHLRNNLRQGAWRPLAQANL